MVRLASSDRPAVLCLQELPVWALHKLAGWSGMTAVVDVAQRPMLGPIPSTATIGRVLTDLDHGLLRSAFTGQANAILLGPELRLLEHRHVSLNPYRFRRAQARVLKLGAVARLAWAKERRVCQVIRVRRGDGTLVIANLHGTSYPPDRRLPDAELLRAAVFADGMARPDEPLVLAGDFNASLRTSMTLPDLLTEEWSFEGATPGGIDHVLVRGLRSVPPERWEPDRRVYDGQLLSDHAPVEREVA
jgi:endonuclease/exonuclease/phosphatase family metal-dependent hydrolase